LAPSVFSARRSHGPSGGAERRQQDERPDRQPRLWPGATGTPQIAGDAAPIQATLADATVSQAAYATITALRAGLDHVGDGGAPVGGNNANNLDVQIASQRHNRMIIPLVMLVVLRVLGVLHQARRAAPARGATACRPPGNRSAQSVRPSPGPPLVRLEQGSAAALRAPGPPPDVVVVAWAAHGRRAVVEGAR
jgi:hypothetical protein